MTLDRNIAFRFFPIFLNYFCGRRRRRGRGFGQRGRRPPPRRRQPQNLCLFPWCLVSNWFQTGLRLVWNYPRTGLELVSHRMKRAKYKKSQVLRTSIALLFWNRPPHDDLDDSPRNFFRLQKSSSYYRGSAQLGQHRYLVL